MFLDSSRRTTTPRLSSRAVTSPDLKEVAPVLPQYRVEYHAVSEIGSSGQKYR